MMSITSDERPLLTMKSIPSSMMPTIKNTIFDVFSPLSRIVLKEQVCIWITPLESQSRDVVQNLSSSTMPKHTC